MLRGGGAGVDVDGLLTVLITTSPTHSNPSTRLLEEVVATFPFLPGLSRCRAVVVCDGANVKDYNNFRQGAIKEEHVARYEAYKGNLRDLCRAGGGQGREAGGEGASPLAGAVVLELQGRHGFAHAVRRGMELVTTPYVMVVQHDRNFCRHVDLPGILRAMEAEGSVNYVGLPSGSHTRDYANFVHSKYKELRVAPEVMAGGVVMVPLVQYYDSTHVGRTRWYREFVFRPGGLFVTEHGAPKKSMFIEDKLAQVMLADLRGRGMGVHREAWGVWLLDVCAEGATVQHINAHDLRVDTPGYRKVYRPKEEGGEQAGGREQAGSAGGGRGDG